ncbi:MAG: hypothetical protein A2114_00090 [Candidatus Vogelbacteria bacterium GWA1_51_14]|uniref:Type I restriction modification DNA specificity domain-containing protein n=1 Tax=Candidatus Vogelbacteria bacterium GWA1_51_14 TaxID=1802435 RepID=A0A1G2QBY6_9BACT|nr:MAG: hypothetical protein A2114_00090 [Candidatus Vogelbacteria bacterium GWA1_51_14]
MKLTKLSNLFEIKYGVNLELINLEETQAISDESVCFVSRTESNNGVSAFVKKQDGVMPIPGNTLTVAVGGSVLSTFLQPYNYYSGRDLYFLTPKKDMTERELIYYSICLKRNKYKYNYGRQANKTLKDILVPEDVPERFKNLKIDNLDTKSLNSPERMLHHEDWQWFKLSDLFTLERGKCGSAEKLLEKGNEISYVGAKKEDNGFMYKVVRDENYVTKSNCIVFIGDGQGSVGYSTYQEADFIGSTTLSMGRNDNLNKYNAIFIITLLDKERFKYSFGRKWNGEKLKNTKIKLPANKDGSPDWQFMEDYIKSLPYSASI